MHQADEAPVAAVDDREFDPRRIRNARGRLEVRRTRRCGVVPIEVRLADRHERDARADAAAEGTQGEDRLVGRARADTDAGDRRRSRARNPRARSQAVLAAAGALSRGGSRIRRDLVRCGLPRARGRGAGEPRRSDLRQRAREFTRGPDRRPSGRSERDTQAEPRDRAAALRPDEPAARGQPPLRLVGAPHAERRAALLRGAQTPHLPAHRLALPSERLPLDRGRGLALVRRGRPVPGRGDPPAREGSREHRAHLRRRESLGSLRDHPDRAEFPKRACPATTNVSSIWSPDDFSRTSTSPRSGTVSSA